MSGSLELGREELEDRLRKFDRAVSLLYPGQTFQLVLVGGGAMVLLGCLARSTADLDALSVSRKLVSLMAQYDINCRVTAYLNSKMNARRYRQFLHNYREYRQECGPCDA